MPPQPFTITLTPSIPHAVWDNPSATNFRGQQRLNNVTELNTQGGLHSNSEGTWVGGDRFADGAFTIGTGGELNSPTIDALNASLLEAESDLSQLDADLGELDTDLADLETDLETAEGLITSLNTELDELDDSLGDLALLDTIGDGQIVDGAISGVKISNGTIVGDKLVANTIVAGKIDTDAIRTRHLQSQQIVTRHLAGEQVTAAKIAGGTITATQIAGETITGEKIAGNTITANKLTVGELSAISQDVGTLTAGSITGVSITGALFRTATSGERIEMDTTNTNQIRFYNSSTYYGKLEVDSEGENGVVILETDNGSYMELTTDTGASGYNSATLGANGGNFDTSGNATSGSMYMWLDSSHYIRMGFSGGSTDDEITIRGLDIEPYSDGTMYLGLTSKRIRRVYTDDLTVTDDIGVGGDIVVGSEISAIDGASFHDDIDMNDNYITDVRGMEFDPTSSNNHNDYTLYCYSSGGTLQLRFIDGNGDEHRILTASV